MTDKLIRTDDALAAVDTVGRRFKDTASCELDTRKLLNEVKLEILKLVL